MFLLDTNVVSELRKAHAGKADPQVTSWAARQPSHTLFVSAISVLELQIGALRLAHRDPRQGAMLIAWIGNLVLPAFAGRILAVDTAVALCCAALHVPDPRSDRDALIAATALVHGMAVATRNINDFLNTGVPLVDPWQALPTQAVASPAKRARRTPRR